ncbi:MAG: ATP-dependent DNA helicase RecG [Gammaproteobacteria bacterium RIFCSPHIGHO2_12_FULL_37_14]|nr:MAG: ATP-dependent DNA helicase RecG [Gammaproteobacteria bacterium RIFCSPHIGHO2_12_FULL_37_14]
MNQHSVPVDHLRGVGKQIVKHLARLDIYSIQDVLFHLPLRYQDRTHIQTIHSLIPDMEAVIEGVIQTVSMPKRGRTKLLCVLKDETGKMCLRFFHVLSFQSHIFKLGVRLRCYGVTRLGPNGFEMIHPEFQVITPTKPIEIEKQLTPIYPATEGLSQYMLRKITAQALVWMNSNPLFEELIPASIRQSHSFPAFKEALYFIHRPPRETSIVDLINNKTLAQQRLIFEELLAHRMSLLHAKQAFKWQPGISLNQKGSLISNYLKNLSFQLTSAQQRVCDEISNDLNQSYPMLRLIQGDVGSGKTVVAALAMLQAVENGYQAVLMAPTELLAEQHYRVFKKWLEPLNLSTVFLSGSMKASIKKSMLTTIANGEAQIIIGTHALFQENVHFSKLALVIIDEQHRFGVHQRALLREKGVNVAYHPHQLIMTATPIPRTLAMSFYADLDCSLIDELPPGRTPVVTSVLANHRRHEVIDRVREACQQGRQVYWVCPLIEESEAIHCQAAVTLAEQLRAMLNGIKVGLIHGRTNSADKEAMMHAFQLGQVHVLVATTIIEVGVDVANASVMVIENAERLGLSQLHQLRGRVGRGSVASHCLLLYQSPLTDLAKERLGVMRETTDGFKIAQKDLELRGPGEILGTRQTGELSFKVADLIRDHEMVLPVQQAADLMLREQAHDIQALVKRWLGKQEMYGKV